ncbi:hypothetical protein GCM10010293_21830 [Streptomyces griseoflavus]|nr:hypothetical protein GCM10010293_21830 [Streptomyces griseoflavus]
MNGGRAGQGWEKCYVLGKESARTRRRRDAPESPAITPERQPLVAPDTHHAQPCWTGFAGRAKTPLSKSRRHCRRLCPVGTQRFPRPDRLSGCGVLDRASPIVVHSRPPHKGVRYSLVTGG